MRRCLALAAALLVAQSAAAATLFGIVSDRAAPVVAEAARRHLAAHPRDRLVLRTPSQFLAAPDREAKRWLAEADAVLANLNPFRGAEPDSGTCVEIGYALALGKPIFGYAEDMRPLRERLQAVAGGDGCCRDGEGLAVEDFGLPLNLMLAVPLQLVQGGLAEALRELGHA